MMKEIVISLIGSHISMYVNDTCDDNLSLDIPFEQFSSLAVRMSDGDDSLVGYVDSTNIDHVLATMNALGSPNKKYIDTLKGIKTGMTNRR